MFSDSGEIGGRRIPRAADVGYLNKGTYHASGSGRITGYTLLP